MIVPRVEGRLAVEADPSGRLRVAGEGPRHLERRLLGRAPADAVYLVQQVTASGATAHALAALRAWEQVAGATVAPNGARLREVLHLLAFLHAHVEHLYFTVLPDYLPLAAVRDYGGSESRAHRLALGLGQLPDAVFADAPRRTAFRDGERDRLAERMGAAGEALALLQRMLAELGGKFPVVMSLVPGGITVDADPARLLRLEMGLGRLEAFLTEAVLEDVLLLLERHPETLGLGWGGGSFLSSGLSTGGEPEGVMLFPGSLVVDGRIQPGEPAITESIHHARYRLALEGDPGGTGIVPAPDKPGAYSWIKSPRADGAAVETGPVARLIVTQEAGTHGRMAGIAELVSEQLEVPLVQANTVGGRLLALAAELEVVFRRCRETLAAVEPGAPTRATAPPPEELTGEGVAAIEGPAGAVRHHLGLRDGRIAYCDIIGAGTWNGASRDERGVPGPLELALGHANRDLEQAADRLTVSRIVHSFAISASDAVH